MRAIATYLVAAAVARMSDAGAVIGVVLLLTDAGYPGAVVGLLAACITAPHLAGPFVARSLDLVADGRRVIAAACVVYALMVSSAALVQPFTHPAVVGLLLATAGTCGPLLTGGISSRLPAIVGDGQVRQRRAQGGDVATYALGGSAGPALVAAVSAAANPRIALVVLSVGTLLAGALIMLLPRDTRPRAADGAPAPGPLASLRAIGRSGPLRRTLLLTVSVAFGVAALPVVAVRAAGEFGISPATGAALVSVYWLGNLAGSALLAVRPLRGAADRAMAVIAAALAAALPVVLLAHGAEALVVAYAIAGVMNSHFFAATLAARTEYAPAGLRNQVFVWIAALKITAGSAGTAAAGALTDLGGVAPIAVACVAIATAVAAALVDARRTPHSPDSWNSTIAATVSTASPNASSRSDSVGAASTE